MAFPVDPMDIMIKGNAANKIKDINHPLKKAKKSPAKLIPIDNKI